MYKKHLILLLIISSFIFSFSCKTQKGLKEFSWISGKWATEEIQNIRFYEEWELENDSLLSGKNYALRAGDTVHSETLKITLKDKTVYYSARVTNEENAQPVKFKLEYGGKDSITFINNLHTFPQEITYKKESDSTMVLRLKGVIMVDSKEQAQEKEVELTRIKKD